MADLFEGQRDRRSEYVKAFRPVQCQVGAVLAINGEVMGLECFRHNETLAEFAEKLVKSYALDVLEGLQDNQGARVRTESMKTSLQAVKGSTKDAHHFVGFGEDVRLWGPAISGAAPILNRRVIHLSAFKGKKQDTGRGSTGMERFSQRRRRRLG